MFVVNTLINMVSKYRTVKPGPDQETFVGYNYFWHCCRQILWYNLWGEIKNIDNFYLGLDKAL